MNETIKKFGYPQTKIKEYEHWVILLRPDQVTIGSLILAYKKDVTSFSEVSYKGLQELKIIYSEIENNLEMLFGMEKINYLALMMVDNNVHYHVIPRYSKVVTFIGIEVKDYGWPSLPNFSISNKINTEVFDEIRSVLVSKFN
jgi:diadenosine tetraphosphate (Ap4A) HIT family hydrolase